MALVVLCFLIPIVVLFRTSFENYPLLGRVSPAGTANYTAGLHDAQFGASVLFTLKYAAIFTPLSVIIGYLLAVLLRARRRGVSVFRTVYFMPVVVGFATVGYTFYIMLQPGIGILSTIFSDLGLTSLEPLWLIKPGESMAWVVAMTLWKTVGLTMILYLAGMQGVSTEVYEAAMVDGAGWLTRERRIIFPLVRRTTALVLLLTVTGSLLTFDQFYVLTAGGPNDATMTAVYWIYDVGFVRYAMGYAAALAVVVLVALMIFTSAELTVLRRGDAE